MPTWRRKSIAVGGWTRNYGIFGPVQFFSDSTWATPNTAGGLLFFAANVAYGANYNEGWSERQGRHVFEDGLSYRDGMTIGHVFATKGNASDELISHETWHITQQRIFGPVQPLSYLICYGVAGGAGVLYGWAAGDERPWKRGELWAYHYNPWELWAYRAANWDTWKTEKNRTARCAESGNPEDCDPEEERR